MLKRDPIGKEDQGNPFAELQRLIRQTEKSVWIHILWLSLNGKKTNTSGDMLINVVTSKKYTGHYPSAECL